MGIYARIYPNAISDGISDASRTQSVIAVFSITS